MAPSTFSTVTPGQLATFSFAPVKALKSVVFPQFGFPINPILKSSLMLFYLTVICFVIPLPRANLVPLTLTISVPRLLALRTRMEVPSVIPRASSRFSNFSGRSIFSMV